MFRLLAPFCLLPGLVSPVFAQTDRPPRVVASIKPLHALVGGIMEGTGEPVLLIDGSMSPHGYRLTPTDARRLETADLVIWIGPSLESKLAKPLRNLVPADNLLTLGTQPKLTRLPAREGGAWTDHDHGDTHAGIHDYHDDPHIWLDPRNARKIVDMVAGRLQQLDPAHAELYADNTRQMQARIEALDREIAVTLADVKNIPYLVFHDALQYFEHRYGLSPAGTLTIDPERSPGARRLLELRQLIREKNIRCVFHEPQFGTKVVDVLLEDTGAKLVTLDPLGLNVAPGSEGYLQLLQQLAADMRGCLAGK
ncbi:MAG TPA: zinc ABC transporter substrate-binding protein [Gammaproteobacteria bacterium]